MKNVQNCYFIGITLIAKVIKSKENEWKKSEQVRRETSKHFSGKIEGISKGHS
jgi:hypothetical protein